MPYTLLKAFGPHTWDPIRSVEDSPIDFTSHHSAVGIENVYAVVPNILYPDYQPAVFACSQFDFRGIKSAP